MKVLLVDDDPAIRMIVAAVLRAGPGGHEVREAGDGAGALAALAAERPDVVLLDYRLPDGDGAALLARLRVAVGDLPPVVFLTGRDDAATVARLLALGARGVIPKPFDPERLPGRLERLLAPHPDA